MSVLNYVWCNTCQSSHAPGALHVGSMAQGEPIADTRYLGARPVTFAADRVPEATPLDESLLDAQRIAGLMVEQMQELAKRVEALQTERRQSFDLEQWNVMEAERRHIVEVLSAFVHAPISISSLQPVLDLAVELNPSLKERR